MNHPRWAAMTAIALGLTLQAPLAISAVPADAQAPNAVQSQPQMAPTMPAPNVVAPDARNEQAPGTSEQDRSPGANDEDQPPGANDEDQAPNANDEDRAPGANDEDQSPDVPPGSRPRQPDASGGIRV